MVALGSPRAFSLYGVLVLLEGDRAQVIEVVPILAVAHQLAVGPSRRNVFVAAAAVQGLVAHGVGVRSEREHGLEAVQGVLWCVFVAYEYITAYPALAKAGVA